MRGRTVGRVHGDLGRGQGQDEPSVAGVDRPVPAEQLTQRRPVGLGVRAVDDRVRSGDHGSSRRWFGSRAAGGRQRRDLDLRTRPARRRLWIRARRPLFRAGCRPRRDAAKRRRADLCCPDPGTGGAAASEPSRQDVPERNADEHAPDGVEAIGYRQELKRSLSFTELLVYGLIFMVPIAPFGIFGITPLYDSSTFSLGLVFGAVSIAVLSFLGFDGISTLAEENRESTRMIGRSMIAALAVAGLLFVVQTWIAALLVPDPREAHRRGRRGRHRVLRAAAVAGPGVGFVILAWT